MAEYISKNTPQQFTLAAFVNNVCVVCQAHQRRVCAPHKKYSTVLQAVPLKLCATERRADPSFKLFFLLFFSNIYSIHDICSHLQQFTVTIRTYVDSIVTRRKMHYFHKSPVFMWGSSGERCLAPFRKPIGRRQYLWPVLQSHA